VRWASDNVGLRFRVPDIAFWDDLGVSHEVVGERRGRDREDQPNTLSFRRAPSA
jgi:hypothetical protein